MTRPGIPAGVKMYSGVFGVTPLRSAQIVLDYLNGDLGLAEVEGVLDIDEERYPRGDWAVRLHATAPTPFEPSYTQSAKAQTTAVGGLGVDTTLLRVDALVDRRMVGVDVNEEELHRLVLRHPRSLLVLSPIGAQGYALAPSLPPHLARSHPTSGGRFPAARSCSGRSTAVEPRARVRSSTGGRT